MKSQNGSSLLVSLVLLTIITLVAVYSIEGSSIQTKMVANSLFSTLTYQECRNEQEANVRFYNSGERDTLLAIRAMDPPILVTNSITMGRADYAPKSDNISVSWNYLKEAPAGREGYDISTDSTSKSYQFENNCIAQFNFSMNSQTLGAIVEGLAQAGTLN